MGGQGGNDSEADKERAGEGGQEPKGPQETGTGPSGKQREVTAQEGVLRSRRSGVQARDGQNASATWELPAPSRHPALGRGQREAEADGGTLSILGGWVGSPGAKCREEQSSAELCVVCVQTAATSTPGMAMKGHGGGQRPNQVPSAPGVVWDGPKGKEAGNGGKQIPPSAWHFPSLSACWLPASQGSRSTLGTSTASHLPSVCHRWEGWCQEKSGDMGLVLGQTQGFGQGDWGAGDSPEGL